MTVVDYAVLAIVGLSVLISVWRGAVREVLALAAWILAFLAGQAYASTAAAYMPASIDNEALRLLAGFVSIFLLVLLLTMLVAVAISTLLRSAGLGPAMNSRWVASPTWSSSRSTRRFSSARSSAWATSERRPSTVSGLVAK